MPAFLIPLFLGFLVKTVTGLDDTAAKVPVLAGITRTRAGKLAFAVGNMAAVLAAILFAVSLSFLFGDGEIFRWLSGLLILSLALVVRFDLFRTRSRFRVDLGLVLRRRLTTERFLKLVGVGFVVSLLTLLDDAVAFIPLFLVREDRLLAAAGIVLASALQLFLLIYFSAWFERLKHRHEIAFWGLLAYGILILAGVL